MQVMQQYMPITHDLAGLHGQHSNCGSILKSVFEVSLLLHGNMT